MAYDPSRPIILIPQQVANRLRRLLPQGWFPEPPRAGQTEKAPLLAALMQGMGAVLAPLTTLLEQVWVQTRLKTMTGGFIDMWAEDFFGDTFVRQKGESDEDYKKRLRLHVIPERNTRFAVLDVAKVYSTSADPLFTNPRFPMDTKVWGGRGLSSGMPQYPWNGNVRGVVWGTRHRPFQSFLRMFNDMDNQITKEQGDAIATVISAGNIPWSANRSSIDSTLPIGRQ